MPADTTYGPSPQSDDDLVDFFENGVLGLHLVNAEGMIVRANQAELDLLGYTREEYIGHHISEFHADAAVIKDILQRLANNEILRNYEARVRAKDGTIKHVLISSNVCWRDGRFLHTRCFTRDITDRKKADEERDRLMAELEMSRRLLQEKVEELEKFYDAVVGREIKMMELEKEVTTLRQQLAQQPRQLSER
ncbi:MAG TPA: PAS domain-containing protein [Nitrospiraceae bacterium]|nr:PAS domain-containing protein [Nitrospiraceae bacterium]